MNNMTFDNSWLPGFIDQLIAEGDFELLEKVEKMLDKQAEMEKLEDEIENALEQREKLEGFFKTFRAFAKDSPYIKLSHEEGKVICGWHKRGSSGEIRSAVSSKEIGKVFSILVEEYKYETVPLSVRYGFNGLETAIFQLKK